MIQQLLNIAKKQKYKVFKEPYKLNIWGIRSDGVEAGKFDDWIVCFWYNEKGRVEWAKFQATTDPGTYFLQNPMQDLGAAILKQGQYLDVWQAEYNSRLGFYALELVQRLGVVTIIREMLFLTLLTADKLLGFMVSIFMQEPIQTKGA